MSDDNLESLDNASLRKKCLEFGLPNVPITDTSRKLLIRKLRTAMNGETDDKKKNRRETIHVTKIPSLVEANSIAPVEDAPNRPPSRLNRRTIAATSVSSTVDDTTLPEIIKKSAPIDKRRNTQNELPPKLPVSQKRKTAAVLAEEDEDDDDVILLEAAEQSERDVVIPRNRRSVSLSKTGVVTTSYSQETVVAPPATVHETESESEYDFTAKYAGLYEPISRPLAKSQEINRGTSYGLSEPQVVVEPDRTLSFRTTAVNRTSIDPEIVYSKPSQTVPSRYSTLGSGYSSNNASSLSTSTTRRYTSAGYGEPSTPITKYTNMYDNQDENEENQGSETPFLSDFARKLERLKAEPLVKGIESPRSIPMKREPQRFHSSIVGRRSTMQPDSVADSFKNFVIALDRKYNLKRNFSILFVVILVLFIYIVFIH